MIGTVPVSVQPSAFSLRTHLLASALCLAACDQPHDVSPAEGAPAPSQEPQEAQLLPFCERMCERTTSCGLELARHEAGPADAELLAKLEAERPDQARACRDACGADSLDTEAMRFQLERVGICLAKPTCDELATCMAAM
jgi:hypothetical protein